jgi:hypothetical protein
MAHRFALVAAGNASIKCTNPARRARAAPPPRAPAAVDALRAGPADVAAADGGARGQAAAGEAALACWAADVAAALSGGAAAVAGGGWEGGRGVNRVAWRRIPALEQAVLECAI